MTISARTASSAAVMARSTTASLVKLMTAVVGVAAAATVRGTITADATRIVNVGVIGIAITKEAEIGTGTETGNVVAIVTRLTITAPGTPGTRVPGATLRLSPHKPCE
jgi:hypothetical protein